MKEIRHSETELSRELTFKEWLDRDFEYCQFNEDENWWEGEPERDLPGIRITYLLNIPEWEEAKKHLRNQYWKEVDMYFHSFRSSIESHWKELADAILVEREIEVWTYALYPEKYLNKPLPILLTIFQYPESPSTEPNLYRKIAIAYAEIQRDFRDELQTRKEIRRRNHCLAEGVKKLLDWLHGFKSFLDSSGRKDEMALLDFDAGEKKSVTDSSTNQRKFLKDAHQAAIVLRYQGTALCDPTSDPKREANSLAYKLIGISSPTSGLYFYRKWTETKCSQEYYKSLVSGYNKGTIKRSTINKHIKDLEAVIEYFKDNPLRERVIADHSWLKTAIDSD